MEIDHSVIVVTGASAGIGAATARAAATAGARLVLVARRADRLEALAAQLPDALAVPADLTRHADVQAVVDRAVERYGRIDALVNNAGQGLHVPLAELTADDLRAVTELNVIAPLLAMQAVTPVMRAAGGGAIVNISSGLSLRPLPGVGGYAATKCALNMLSQVARIELASHGIVVSLVYPSLTTTEFHDSLRAGRAGSGGRVPLVPYRAEEVAEVILRVLGSGEAEAVLPARFPAGQPAGGAEGRPAR